MNYKDYPSVTYVEKDSSQYIPQTETNTSSSVGIVGIANWGSYDPIFINSASQKKFLIGTNLKDYPLSGLLVERVLASNGVVYFKRAKFGSPTKASKKLYFINETVKPKAEITVSDSTEKASFTENEQVDLKWNFAGTTYTATFTCASAGDFDLADVIQNIVVPQGWTITLDTNKIIIEKAVAANGLISNVQGTIFAKKTEWAKGSETFTLGKTPTYLNFEAVYDGSMGNKISFVFKRVKDASISPTVYTYSLSCYFNENLLITFNNIDLFNTESSNYLFNLVEGELKNYVNVSLIGENFSQDILNTIEEIYAEYDASDNLSPEVGTINFALENGEDNFPTETGALRTALKNAVEEFDNLQQGSFRILLVAYDFTNSSDENSFINSIISIAEKRKDCIFLISSPKNLSETQIQTWVNEMIGFNSSHCAVYSNYGITYDNDNKQTVDVPSVYFVVKNYLQMAKIYHIPAGFDNGIVDITGIDKIWNEQTVMPIFQGGRNVVNPIIKENFGFYINGQKTTLRTNTALNRINTRLALCDFSMNVLNFLKQIKFKANDEDVRTLIKKNIDIMKLEYLENKAFSSIDVVTDFDEGTNLNEIINDNALVLKIHLTPVKSTEKILLEITLHEYGWTISES